MSSNRNLRHIATISLVGVLAITAAGCSESGSEPQQQDPMQWVQDTAVPFAPVGSDGPEAPLATTTGLRVIDEVVAGATVVGLGESAHGLGDQFALRQRLARYLVEHHGFRTIAFEEDYGSGVAIDRYITDRTGDPRELVRSMVAAWQSEQMADVIGGFTPPPLDEPSGAVQ